MTGKTHLVDALEQKTVTMHLLLAKGNETGESLGPAFTVELSLERQVKALGDPMTI